MRLLGLLILLVAAPWVSRAQSYAVIANDIGTMSLTTAELKSAFKPKNNFWTNKRPVLLVLPGNQSPLRDKIAKDLYGTSYVASQKYWLSLVFQGRFNAPVSLSTDEETLSYVSKNPGAIGFVADPSAVPQKFLILIKD